MITSTTKARIRKALKASRAVYADLRLGRVERTEIELKTRTLESLGTTVEEGGIARALGSNGGWGTATFLAADEMEAALERALAAALVLDAEPLSLPPLEPVEDERVLALQSDFRTVSLAEKREAVTRIEDALLGEDPRVQDSRVFYRDQVTATVFASTEGTFLRDERALIKLDLKAIASSGDELQTASDGFACEGGFEHLRGKEELARATARRAALTLAARPVPGGVYTVILDPVLAGVLVHEAFGHLCEADASGRNSALAALVKPGRRVASSLVNVTDFGAPDLEHHPGNVRFDDEGVPGSRTELVRAGVLVGRLHSRETAARDGERPTGNARAEDVRFPPLVRMTKTVVERGTTPLAQLFEGVELGLYARGSRGGETDLGRYSFTAEEAFLVRDGVVAERVRDVTLTGNIFDTLERVTAVADDFNVNSRGRCGKNGQSVAVTAGGPHLRIEGLTVGGPGVSPTAIGAGGTVAGGTDAEPDPSGRQA